MEDYLKIYFVPESCKHEYENRTTWAGDVDNTWGYACVVARAFWEISVLSSQFCYEHKTALHQQNINKSERMSRMYCQKLI